MSSRQQIKNAPQKKNGNGFKAKTKSRQSEARQALIAVARMKKEMMSNMETKFLDTATAANVISNSGEIHLSSANIILQGDTDSGRDGRKVIAKNLQIRFMVTLPSSTTVANMQDVVRIIVYRDRQANGAAATIAKLFNGTSIFAFGRLANKGRFSILAEETITLNGNIGTGSTPNSQSAAVRQYGKIFRKLNFPLEFSGIAGDITDVASNNIGIAAFTESGFITLETNVRLRYTDN